MKKCLKVTKKNILQKRTFTLKLTADDTIAFAFLAAERGITSEQLIESFVRDIVSSFSADEIAVEEKHLFDWFNGSWFSQDNDGYFSFLQYIIHNKYYENIAESIAEIRMCNDEISKGKNIEFNKSMKIKGLETVESYFKEYCNKNPAHKSFGEEFEAVADFDKNIEKLKRGGKCQWR